MGHNPKYRMWGYENWMGYAPTISHMVQRGWSLTIHCPVCRLDMAVDPQKIVRERGRNWSPWGKSARCPRLYCVGRMRMKAYAPGPNTFIDS